MPRSNLQTYMILSTYDIVAINRTLSSEYRTIDEVLDASAKAFSRLTSDERLYMRRYWKRNAAAGKNRKR